MEMARALALEDPRCGLDGHALIVTQPGASCPACHLDLHVYLQVVPADWPDL
jgi:hypothetical protein